MMVAYVIIVLYQYVKITWVVTQYNSKWPLLVMLFNVLKQTREK